MLEVGMRVRCVDDMDLMNDGIRIGRESFITKTNVQDMYVNVDNADGNFWPWRFKPVYRVKMGRADG